MNELEYNGFMKRIDPTLESVSSVVRKILDTQRLILERLDRFETRLVELESQLRDRKLETHALAETISKEVKNE